MVPVLEQVSSSMIDKIQVVKIDTEKYPDIANKYGIQALPTLILFKDGKPLDRFVSIDFVINTSSSFVSVHIKFLSTSFNDYIPTSIDHIVFMAAIFSSIFLI